MMCDNDFNILCSECNRMILVEIPWYFVSPYEWSKNSYEYNEIIKYNWNCIEKKFCYLSLEILEKKNKMIKKKLTWGLINYFQIFLVNMFLFWLNNYFQNNKLKEIDNHNIFYKSLYLNLNKKLHFDIMNNISIMQKHFWIDFNKKDYKFILNDKDNFEVIFNIKNNYINNSFLCELQYDVLLKKKPFFLINLNFEVVNNNKYKMKVDITEYNIFPKSWKSW